MKGSPADNTDIIDKRKRLRKFQIAGIVISVIAVIAVFVYMNVFGVSEKMTVGLEGAKLYFGETPLRVKIDNNTPLKGTTDEEGNKVINDSVLFLFHTVSDTELTFKKNRLTAVGTTLSKVDNYDLFEDVIRYVSDVYKDRDDYFITDRDTYLKSGYCRISGSADGVELICDIYDHEHSVVIETHAGN